MFEPVRLTATDATSRLVHDGIVIITPEISTGTAGVHLIAEITGSRNLSCRTEILDTSGKTIASQDIPAKAEIATAFTIPSPALYQAMLTLLCGGKAVDTLDQSLGIGSILWGAPLGFPSMPRLPSSSASANTPAVGRLANIG